MSATRVSATLVIGSNGATSIAGTSRGLSTSGDRERFLQLRRSAAAILIGGATFRSEPYTKLRIPVYVSSATLNPGEYDEPIRIFPLSPEDLLAKVSGEIDGPILVEGGAKFLAPLLTTGRIGTLYLTRTTREGDGDFWSIGEFLSEYQRESATDGVDEVFEIWRLRQGNHNDSA